MSHAQGFTILGVLVACSTALILVAIGRLADRHDLPDPPRLYDPEEDRPSRYKPFIFAIAVTLVISYSIFVWLHA